MFTSYLLFLVFSYNFMNFHAFTDELCIYLFLPIKNFTCNYFRNKQCTTIQNYADKPQALLLNCGVVHLSHFTRLKYHFSNDTHKW